MAKIGGSGSESGSGSISQRHGSADPAPDPYPSKNVMDPQHWLHVLNLMWFRCIAPLFQWGMGGGFNFFVQMISTCLPSSRGRGGGSAPCGSPRFSNFKAVLWIRIGSKANPDPAFLVNADPDPGF
jgi:hypothetical protein